MSEKHSTFGLHYNVKELRTSVARLKSTDSKHCQVVGAHMKPEHFKNDVFIWGISHLRLLS